MKKILLVLTVVFSVFTLSACQDTKYSDDQISVIFFTANSGSTEVPSYFNLTKNQLIDEPVDPIRPGFAFEGWYKDYQHTEAWDFDVDKVDTSIVLYAKWDSALFNIIYDLNGGELSTTSYPTDFYAGDTKVLPLPSRTGYTFSGWYLYDWVDETSTKPGDAGYQTLPSTYYEDLYLYAHWDAISVRVTFRTSYPIESSEDPGNPNSQTVDYGEVIDFVMFEDTSQYHFVGWNSKSDGTGTFYENGTIFERTQRITLTGVWELIE